MKVSCADVRRGMMQVNILYLITASFRAYQTASV